MQTLNGERIFPHSVVWRGASWYFQVRVHQHTGEHNVGFVKVTHRERLSGRRKVVEEILQARSIGRTVERFRQSEEEIVHYISKAPAVKETSRNTSSEDARFSRGRVLISQTLDSETCTD